MNLIDAMRVRILDGIAQVDAQTASELEQAGVLVASVRTRRLEPEIPAGTIVVSALTEDPDIAVVALARGGKICAAMLHRTQVEVLN